jgi:hypothetical protein
VLMIHTPHPLHTHSRSSLYICWYPYAQHACAGTGRLVRVPAELGVSFFNSPNLSRFAVESRLTPTYLSYVSTLIVLSKNASTRIVLSQKCQYPYCPQSKMPVRVSSSVKNASTRIVLSKKNARTHIVLSQNCQYPYRPQSKMPIPVSSSVENASTRIVIPIQTSESRMFE